MKISVWAVLFWLFAFAVALPLRADQVRLDELNLSMVQQGWGTAQAGLSVGKQPLQMAGQTFAHGMGTHAPSLAVLQLDGKAQRLRAVVGVNDGGKNETGSVEFLVQGDGKTLFQSGVLRGGDKPKPVDVDLNGVRELKLIVTDGGDNNFSDHANWADAVITYAGTRPAMLAPNTELKNETNTNAEFKPAHLYPPAEKLIASRGGITYFVDPQKGDDGNKGTRAASPWKSFAKINALKLAPGDKVFIAPGVHDVTLAPSAFGSAAKPIEVRFAAGRHEFRAASAAKLCYFVSNAADAPLLPRPVGILVKNGKNLRLVGDKGSEIVFGDRMTEFINDGAENITYEGLTFDFARPTVSEFRVRDTFANGALIEIAQGSTYEIVNGALRWTGDVGSGGLMVQEAIPETGKCWRLGGRNVLSGATAEAAGERLVRLTFASGNGGLLAGHQFQFRNTRRDTTSAVNTRSRDLVFRDCNFYSLPGMGIVSQFTENLRFERVNVAPPPGTIRTCAAWADGFHFSGCRGEIIVDSCNFSGMQDDPINVHGTHLRLIEKTAPSQVLVRFMHPQTYGFAAFASGDDVEFINHQTLRGYAQNTVTEIARKTDKDWLLTLKNPVADFGKDDAIDNTSWYPNVTIRNCTVTMDSCRGFLITTRGKALIEGCTFTRTGMSAILVEDDAEGWFESGPIRDLTIRNNRFIDCGGPVVCINPHNGNSDPVLPVHENIRILENLFDGGGISAKSVRGLTITGNRHTAKDFPLQTTACSQVLIENNTPMP